MANKHIHCPVNGWDCPYWKEGNICSMYPTEDPYEECDDFYAIWHEEIREMLNGEKKETTPEDYICEEDHEDEEFGY